VQRLIGIGKISIAGEVITKNGFVLEKPNTVIDVLIPAPEPIDIRPENVDLDILFEDENVIVINKPAGMVMHPSAGHTSGTLVHAALGYDPFLDGIGGKMRPGIVHRLDKDTSGVVMIAKNDQAHQWLQKQFKGRTTEKFYTALVDKHPPTLSGKIDAPIYRDPNNRKKMAIAPDGKGKNAVTIFHTIKQFKRFSLLDIQILTGRTHQIRVHLASIGSPITGDTMYGNKSPALEIDRHFLHARSLSICLLNETKKTVFNAALPEQLEDLLNDLT
jgi:23S rRNA pseudouridine1911/1915/1917 synthase